MKGLTKTIVALVLVMTLVATMGISAMAANYSTKTVYQANGKISVEANATDLEEGAIVTYVATTDEANVNENTIVYINQAEADENGAAQFKYTTEVTNINASMFFGGSTESTRQKAKNAEDYVIAVTVNDKAAGTVYAAKQADDADVVIRKFDLSGIANLSAAGIKSVSFNGEAIADFAVASKTLIVSTDKIDADGTLAITTTDAVEFVAPKISGSTTVKEGNLVAVAKAPAGEKFGIVLYQNEVPEITVSEVKEGTDYVVLPALGKNVDGIYAVEVEAVSEILAAPFNVKAYAFNGDTCMFSDAAVTIAQ